MSANSTLKTEAIVVRRVNYRESDVIVTLITEKYGRIDATARGGRKSSRRFDAGISPYIIYEASLTKSPKTGYLQLSELSAKRIFENILHDYSRISLSAVATEIIRDFAPPSRDESHSYHVLAAFLESVSSAKNPAGSLLRLIMEILDFEGYFPVMEKCGRCGTEIITGTFSPSVSGMLCHRCSDSAAFDYWDHSIFLQITGGSDDAEQFNMSLKMVRTLVSYCNNVLSKQIKSAELLR